MLSQRVRFHSRPLTQRKRNSGGRVKDRSSGSRAGSAAFVAAPGGDGTKLKRAYSLPARDEGRPGPLLIASPRDFDASSRAARRAGPFVKTDESIVPAKFLTAYSSQGARLLQL